MMELPPSAYEPDMSDQDAAVELQMVTWMNDMQSLQEVCSRRLYYIFISNHIFLIINITIHWIRAGAYWEEEA